MSLDRKEIIDIIYKVYSTIETKDIADWTEYKQGFTEALFSFGVEAGNFIDAKQGK